MHTAITHRFPSQINELIKALLTLYSGRDCIGNAKTGSGKTIAFALPILQKLSVDPYGIYALVLTPTRCASLFCSFILDRVSMFVKYRELAIQIAEQFAVLGTGFNIHTAVVIGGMDMMTQALELERRPHVVIATPGRIVDHLKTTSGGWSFSRVKFLVCCASLLELLTKLNGEIC